MTRDANRERSLSGLWEWVSANKTTLWKVGGAAGALVAGIMMVKRHQSLLPEHHTLEAVGLGFGPRQPDEAFDQSGRLPRLAALEGALRPEQTNGQVVLVSADRNQLIDQCSRSSGRHGVGWRTREGDWNFVEVAKGLPVVDEYVARPSVMAAVRLGDRAHQVGIGVVVSQEGGPEVFTPIDTRLEAAGAAQELMELYPESGPIFTPATPPGTAG